MPPSGPVDHSRPAPENRFHWDLHGRLDPAIEDPVRNKTTGTFRDIHLHPTLLGLTFRVHQETSRVEVYRKCNVGRRTDVRIIDGARERDAKDFEAANTQNISYPPVHRVVMGRVGRDTPLDSLDLTTAKCKLAPPSSSEVDFIDPEDRDLVPTASIRPVQVGELVRTLVEFTSYDPKDWSDGEYDDWYWSFLSGASTRDYIAFRLTSRPTLEPDGTLRLSWEKVCI